MYLNTYFLINALWFASVFRNYCVIAYLILSYIQFTIYPIKSVAVKHGIDMKYQFYFFVLLAIIYVDCRAKYFAYLIESACRIVTVGCQSKWPRKSETHAYLIPLGN